MIFTKVVITNFYQKIRKLLFMFLSKFQMIKDISKKYKNKQTKNFKFRQPWAKKQFLYYFDAEGLT